MTNKLIDAEVHLAMYYASKEARQEGGWAWSKAFAKALYSISPSVDTRMSALRAELKHSDEAVELLHAELQQANYTIAALRHIQAKDMVPREDYNYMKACYEEEKQRRRALDK